MMSHVWYNAVKIKYSAWTSEPMQIYSIFQCTSLQQNRYISWVIRKTSSADIQAQNMITQGKVRLHNQ